ncbi:MAG: hypothetical protein H0T68_12330 [Gemmatimonadales bacterium]|nr:hypothetical protein [Gemmatimonadales bacterium]
MESFLLVVARAGLALVLGAAGAAKLADRAGSRQAMLDFGVPAALAPPLALILPLAELVVALALLPAASARTAGAGAFVLFLLFTTGILWNLARGRRPDCHCFGQLRSRPISPGTAVRNGLHPIRGERGSHPRSLEPRTDQLQVLLPELRGAGPQGLHDLGRNGALQLLKPGLVHLLQLVPLGGREHGGVDPAELRGEVRRGRAEVAADDLVALQLHPGRLSAGRDGVHLLYGHHRGEGVFTGLRAFHPGRGGTHRLEFPGHSFLPAVDVSGGERRVDGRGRIGGRRHVRGCGLAFGGSFGLGGCFGRGIGVFAGVAAAAGGGEGEREEAGEGGARRAIEGHGSGRSWRSWRTEAASRRTMACLLHYRVRRGGRPGRISARPSPVGLPPANREGEHELPLCCE